MKKLVLEINAENEYMRVTGIFVITHEIAEWKCNISYICIDL